MKQIRLSIGCRDWQAIIETIGPEAAGILLYLLSMMRAMQAAEISIRISELAAALHLSDETARTALDSIQAAGYLTQTVDASGVITLRSDDEEKKQNEARRKRAARLLSRFSGQSTGQSGRSRTCTTEVRSAPRADEQDGQSGDTFFDHSGQSADSPKEVYSEVAMFYDPDSDRQTKHALFNHTGQESKKEKNPPTPKKEKSLTESTGHAHASAPVREAELPVDKLETEYIDVCGLMPQSLRETIRTEADDVREAFYLYVRQRREEDGSRWAGDRIRIAWLAARRIPAERRAESILAAAMGNWKTIRDAGSGMYFEKSSGRIVSLVRGPVEYKPQNETEKSNAELAVKLARNMRRG